MLLFQLCSGQAALVAAVLALLPQQAVVLEVVDDLQQREAEHRLDQQVGQDDRAEGDRQRGEEADGHRPGAEDVVAQAPVRLARCGRGGRASIPQAERRLP